MRTQDHSEVMMNSVILRTASRLLLTLLLLFSVFLLLRGHNLPGGGFAGGLIAAGAWALYSVAHGTDAARVAIRVEPRQILGAGLLTVLFSAIAPIVAGGVLLKGVWIDLGSLRIGTPMLFDGGVYLVVLGATLLILFSLEEL